MAKIVWKSFRANIKNFLAFFASVIMTVNVLFLFMYVQQSVAAIQVMDSSKLLFSIGGDLPRLFWSLIPEILVVSIVVIVYSVRFYIRSRMKDYGILTVLGIREKDMKKLIVMEYSLSCIVSCAAGLLIGRVTAYFIGKSFRKYVGASFVEAIDMSKVYGLTALMCVVMIAGALLAISIMLNEKGVSDSLQSERIKDKRLAPKWSLFCLIIGLGLVIGSLIIAAKTGNPFVIKVALLLLCIGVIVSTVWGAGCVLESYRRSERYYKKIFVWNDFYHYFGKNKYLIVIQAVIGIVLIYFSFSISSSLIPSSKEPNDFVCTVEPGQGFLQEFQDKYGGTQKSFPFVYVNNEEGSEVRIGISLSDFNRVFERQETLGEDEIISLKSGEDIGSLANTSIGGQMSDKLFLGQDVGYNRLDELEGKSYKLKEEEVENLLGFQIGGLAVLPDAVFAEAAEKDQFYQDFLILNVENSLLSEATEFVEAKKAEGILDEAICRKTMEEMEYRQNFFSVVIMGIVGVAVLFFGMFVAWLKIFAETGQLEDKYEFLSIEGMREKEKRRTLKKESGLTIWIPTLVAAVTAGLFCAAFIFKAYNGIYSGRAYYSILLLLLFVYIVLEVVFLSVVRLWMQRRVLAGHK